MHPILQKLLPVFFPNRCAFCGAVIRPGLRACEPCGAVLPYVCGKVCATCGREQIHCGCGRKTFAFERCIAPFYYESAVKKGIWRFKFSGRQRSAAALAGYMADTVRREYPGLCFDFVTAVPQSKKELRKRGYNQSALLGQALAGLLALPYRQPIQKICETKPQRGCTAQLRWGNIFGAFDVKEDLTGKTVLLADDVMTTGATLNECAKMLRLAGATGVYCVAAACVKGFARAENPAKRQPAKNV